MLFDDSGPDIPISLLRAQRAGNLLFIVGAGVSKAAGLPLFGELADLVYARLGQAVPGAPGSLASQAEFEARQAGQYDRLIGLLEQRLVYRGVDWRQPHNSVREAVAALVQPGPRARIAAHADLLDLSRAADGRPRIITTNFDTLFERAWRRRTNQHLTSSAGQGMPAVGSQDFTGVLHLHGRVADRRYGLSETDLVLTSANFGEAYMRSGWASRFVYDLLRRYSLVLVGYSADDPPMRYMLEATEDGRLNFPDLKPAFALVGDTANDAGTLREAWRGKGVQPLVYPAPDHDHGALYRTLGVWAQLARAPLEWSEGQLARIGGHTREEAAAADKESFSYLTREVSSVTVAAAHAADPAWIEEILPADSEESWTFIAWFRERLQSAETARYAASAGGSLKLQIAHAVDVLLRTRHEPLPQLYQQYWLLYVQANLRTLPSALGRIRGGDAVTTNRIQELVGLIEPRLQVEGRFRWRESDEPLAAPVNVHDLAQFSFQASDRDWLRRLERWPEDARAEERLLLALDRSLCEAIEVGYDAGLVQPDGDLMSFDLALVHAPEPDEGLVDPNDRHKGNWRLNQPDAHNDHFAPLVRTMTGLWRRLVSRDAHRAARIATAWAERDALIFKRLAAWTAIEGDSAPARVIELYLRDTTRTRYWESDNSPELVRFYCKRWNKLASRTRQAVEHAILAGMLPEVIQRIAQRGSRAYARALYTTRELARIRTAGGRLSREASRRLSHYYRAFPDLPREMPIYAHLYNPSWSGSGYSADIRVLDEVTDSQLLESTEAFEAGNRIEQADLWRVFVRSEPVRAFAALQNAQAKGEFSPYRWQPFLSLYASPETEPASEDCPRLGDVLGVIAQVPSDALASVTYQLARIIERHARALHDPLFPQILALWDQLAPIAASPEQDERDRPLSELVFSHPLGTIADSLVSMLDEMNLAPDDGIAEALAGRFDLLAGLEGRAGLIARGALLQQLAFLRTIAPGWVDANLLPGLLEQTDDAIDLMSVVARSVAPQYAELFNLLKAAIFHALEHERTDEAIREHLSGALVGAAFAIIEGRGGFDLTSVECRQALTRMPNKVLSSMAWELGSLLRDKKDAGEKAAYWDAAILPFLRDYWPNDVSARTSEVSENLAHLPALAGKAFERAVPVVLDLVCPIQRHELCYGLGLEGDEDLLTEQPRASLLLIGSILDRSAPPPRDLGEVIERLLEAAPDIASEPAFWRLRQMQRAD
ncbi:SIR2 family protein [Sphingomonas sp. JC676]|uniref:SIR2 family protein n=1 Tax=Sphingomonas sp. JC676 TaxID=2768065 RepID=UPI0016582795|nr:SIR2 family protein [Sphingomonas sp. JC676]MBC9033012.1 SIR2 family protein [Sphingomonas sp. JC676]